MTSWARNVHHAAKRAAWQQAQPGDTPGELVPGEADQPQPIHAAPGDHRVTGTIGRVGPGMTAQAYSWTCTCGALGDNRADALAHAGVTRRQVNSNG